LSVYDNVVLSQIQTEKTKQSTDNCPRLSWN